MYLNRLPSEQADIARSIEFTTMVTKELSQPLTKESTTTRINLQWRLQQSQLPALPYDLHEKEKPISSALERAPGYLMRRTWLGSDHDSSYSKQRLPYYRKTKLLTRQRLHLFITSDKRSTMLVQCELY